MRSINAGVQRQIQQEVHYMFEKNFSDFQMYLCLDKKRGLILYKTTYSFSFLKHFEAHVRQVLNFPMLCDACFSSHRTSYNLHVSDEDLSGRNSLICDVRYPQSSAAAPSMPKRQVAPVFYQRDLACTCWQHYRRHDP